MVAKVKYLKYPKSRFNPKAPNMCLNVCEETSEPSYDDLVDESQKYRDALEEINKILKEVL